MEDRPLFSLVLPFHTDVERILVTLELLQQVPKDTLVSEILLCHNGQSLSSGQESQVRKRLCRTAQLLHTDRKGIGAGYKQGIRSASARFVVLSASDLPFGFSDLRSFLERRSQTGKCSQFSIGSKAHPGSRIGGYSFLRRLASIAFWQLRVLLLGPTTPRDSQGSLIVETALAKRLVDRCRHDNYFFSVEMITLAQREGIKLEELPIVLEHHHGGASSVSLLRDGYEMSKNLYNLRRRLKSEL